MPPVTIKDIADLVGVSRGTVDRALHDRGRVDPDVARRIKRVANELGFEPSRAGRALARAKNPVKLGVIIHITKTIFMQQVLEGIRQAVAQLEAMQVEIKVYDFPSPDTQLEMQALDELVAWGAQGIAITPSEEPPLRRKVDDIVTEHGIPVVTFNTDLPGSKRSCFVGQDAYRSGQTAAGLMRVLCQGRGKVSVITGYLTSYAHTQRVDGFVRELAAIAPDIMVTGVQVCYDEDDLSRQVAAQNLAAFPDLSGIFVAAGGQAGVYEAMREAGASGRVKFIGYDLLPATREGLENGTIDFVIDQNAVMQGRRPLELLFEHLLNNAPFEEELQDTGIIIKNKYNL